MARFLDDRAPLEFTKPSSQPKTVVCPSCKYGQIVGKNWYSGECPNCRKYYNEKQSLDISEMIDEASKTKSAGIVSGDYIKLREKVEKQAQDFKKTTAERKAKGIQRTHEPGLKPRDW